jgi:hypothetical protein
VGDPIPVEKGMEIMGTNALHITEVLDPSVFHPPDSYPTMLNLEAGEIKLCRDTHLLFPMPRLSLAELATEFSHLFRPHASTEAYRALSLVSPEPRYMLINRHILFPSMGKEWAYQRGLLGRINERFKPASVIELVAASIVAFREWDQVLFPHRFIRTRDAALEGYQFYFFGIDRVELAYDLGTRMGVGIEHDGPVEYLGIVDVCHL